MGSNWITVAFSSYPCQERGVARIPYQPDEAGDRGKFRADVLGIMQLSLRLDDVTLFLLSIKFRTNELFRA